MGETIVARAGYRFTKGRAQNLNLRTHLKLEYNIKSLNYIQTNFKISSLVPTLLNYDIDIFLTYSAV